MYKKIIILTLMLSLSVTAYNQNLRDLELLTMSGYYVDSAEIKLRTWDYKLENVKNETVANVNYDIYGFTRKSADSYINSVILLFRNKSDVMKAVNFDVRFITYSDKRFNELKDECLKIDKIRFIEQKIEGDLFIRKYEDSWFDYSFIVKNGSSTKNITYSVEVQCDMTNIINDK